MLLYTVHGLSSVQFRSQSPNGINVDRRSILISLQLALFPLGNNLACSDVHFDSHPVLVHAKEKGRCQCIADR